jgi:hypothetical protein
MRENVLRLPGFRTLRFGWRGLYLWKLVGSERRSYQCRRNLSSGPEFESGTA